MADSDRHGDSEPSSPSPGAAATEAATVIKPFYINAVLLNKEEVVAAKVASQLESKGWLRPGGFIGKAATFAANKMVTDERVVSNLADTVIAKITQGVSDMGITANATNVFQSGSFVVIRMQVTEIDKGVLIRAAKGEEFAASFDSLVRSLVDLGLEQKAIPALNQKIHSKVYEGMMAKFAEVLPKKMLENGLNVDVTVCASDEQAEFFFEALSRLGVK